MNIYKKWFKRRRGKGAIRVRCFAQVGSTLLLLSAVLLPFLKGAFGRDRYSGLSGIILDAITGEPLPGAHIILKPGNRGTSSDLQGRFYLKQLLPGKYEISVSYIGYAAYKDSIYLMPDQSLHLHFALKQQPIELQEVTVSASRSDRYQKVNLSHDVIGPHEILMTSSLVEPDLIRTMEHLPGIVLANEFNTRFYVRGGRGNENQVLVDGVTLHNPYHAFGLFNIFNTDAIKRVEIYRGIFPAKYSERLSSVSNVVLRDGNARHFSGQGLFSLSTSKFLIEGPILKLDQNTGRKWTCMLSARRTYLDQLVRKIPFYFYDLSAKTVYDSGQKTRVILHGFFGVDRIKHRPKDAIIGIDWKNRAAGFQLFQFLTPGDVVNISLSYSDFSTTARDMKVSPESFDESFGQQNRIRETRFAWEWSHQIGKSLQATLGYDCSHFSINEYLDNSHQILFAQNWQNLICQKMYLAFEKRWENLGVFEWSLTGLYFKPIGKFQWAPRLGVKWLATDRWRLKAGAGRNYQALTTINDDDDALLLFDAWIPSPTGRPIPRADHFGFGIEYGKSNSVDADVELYYRRYCGLTRFNRSQLSGEPLYLDGWATSYGLEFRIDFRLKKFYGFANYALGKATSHFFLRNQPMRHLNDFSWQSFPSPGDIRHILNAVVGFRTRSQWNFSLSLIFQTGRPYTAFLGSFGDYYYAPPEHIKPPLGYPFFIRQCFLLPITGLSYMFIALKTAIVSLFINVLISARRASFGGWE